MAQNTISSLITHGVILGQGSYGLTLTVSDSGTVAGVEGFVNGFDLVNAGSIYDYRYSSSGIYLLGSGEVNNSGSILDAVWAEGQITVLNSGRISSGSGLPGVILGRGGSLDNSGVVTSDNIGVHLYRAAMLANTGSIFGTTAALGIGAYDGAVNSGTLAGTSYAVEMGGGTLVNLGTVQGDDIGITISAGTILNSGGIFGQKAGLSAYASAGTELSLTNTAEGTIAGKDIGVLSYGPPALAAVSFSNAGIVQGSIAGGSLSTAFLTNTGTFSGDTGLAFNLGSVDNAGALLGADNGVYLEAGTLTNTGLVSGGNAGLVLGSGIADNSGTITGGSFGVDLDGGTLINAGTISGGSDAVFGTAGFTLMVDPGAVFEGDVTDSAGKAKLILGGATASTLSGLGVSFTGFSEIGLAAASNWTVEGVLGGLADGQTIAGFASGDTLVIDGFSATSESYVTGTGLVLSDGSTTETLDITGSFDTANFTIASSVGNTTIFTGLAMQGGATTVQNTINSRITEGVTLGTNNYGPTLTVLDSGTITPPDYYGVGGVVGVLNGFDLVNAGSIRAYTGVGLIGGGTILNAGSIYGVDFGVVTDGKATVFNSGTISAGNVFAVGLGGGGSLDNTGVILSRSLGVQLGTDGTLTNAGSIFGYTAALAIGVYDVAVNNGTLAGNKDAVEMGDGTMANFGTVQSDGLGIDISTGTIFNSGDIFGQAAGIYATSSDLFRAISLTNTAHGTIAGQGSYSTGVVAVSSGEGGRSISFSNAGVVQGSLHGGYMDYAYITNTGTFSGDIGLLGGGNVVDNAGTLLGTALGAYVSDSPRDSTTLTNTGLISGADEGMFFGGSASYDYANRKFAITGVAANSGTITGGSLGVYFSGATITNTGMITGVETGLSIEKEPYDEGVGGAANSGMISGGSVGVFVLGGGTIMNAGTITGATYAIDAHNHYYGAGFQQVAQPLYLIVKAGAVFDGAVRDVAGQAQLTLAGSSAGSLDIGTSFTGLEAISFAAGVAWQLEGAANDIAGGQAISGFTDGDTIVLDGFSAASESYVSGTGLQLSDGATTETLDITGNFDSLDATAGLDNTTITVACFVAGTRIATPDGEAAVESLSIGDQVLTVHAGAQRIKWIGTRSYDGRFIAGNKIALPVCIRAGAIGSEIPMRDLWVSPGHAICIHGVLVHASRLVNGVSVMQAERVERVTYYHIELDAHEIIFAENCPAETFMGEQFRRQFQNAVDFSKLYPNAAATEEICLPRLDSGFQLHAISRRLAARAGISEPSAQGPLRGYVDRAGPELCCGWAQDIAAPETPVCLKITADGRAIGRVLANLYRADLREAGYGSGYHGFEFLLPPAITGQIKVWRATDHALLPQAEAATTQAA